MAQLYIDADSVPKPIREIIIRRIVKNQLEAVFVADRELPDVKKAIAEDTALRREPYRNTLDKDELKKIKSKISMIVVESGTNSADNKLVEIAVSPALAITHDIPLASRLLEKGLVVIDDRGRDFTRDNINYLLSLRDLNSDFRDMGIAFEKSSHFNQRIINEFANRFDVSVQNLLKNNK